MTLAEAASDVAIEVGVNLTINTDSDESRAWELTRTAIAFAARSCTRCRSSPW